MNAKMKQMIIWIKEKMKIAFSRKENIVWLIASALCFLVLIIGSIWIIKGEKQKKDAQVIYENLAMKMQLGTEDNPMEYHVDSEHGLSDSVEISSQQEEQAEIKIVDPYEKKVDFEMLQGTVDSNIHGWIYIPGTAIDYPILQHPSDNTFYLNHNLNGTEGYPGCIYTENYNSKDFSDFNTVIYGHNMKNGTMFADIHNFVEAAYVSEHPFVYVYTAEGMLVYEIYAAYEYEDEHLLADRNLTEERTIEQYLNTLKDAARKNFYKEEVLIDKDSKLITLSTCIRNRDTKRFLVQAVLCK